MFKDDRFINAGVNEIYRYGRKAQEKVSKALVANENGFYSIPADGGLYWTIGTSNGKFGEFANMGGTIFSVNKGGFVWAKVGTEKGDAFVMEIKRMIERMKEIKLENTDFSEVEEE